MNSENITISHSFSKQDWRSILIFRKRAEEFFECKLFTEGPKKITLNLEYTKEQGGSTTVVLPEEHLLKEFYMTFRFFYLEKEPANFNKVINIIKRAARNDTINKFMGHLNKQYTGALSREQVFRVGIVGTKGKEITAKLLLDLWFNAHYFHSDEEKEKDLKLLNDILGTEFSRYLLANSVFEASRAIKRLYLSIKSMERCP